MNKDIRYITILVVGISILGTFSVVNNFGNTNNEFQEKLELGDKAYKKEIYIDAIEYYGEAINADNSNVDVKIKLADSYLNLGNTSEFETILKEITTKNDENEKPFIKLADYYARTENYQKAYETLLNASSVKNRKKIDQLIDTYKSYYRIVGTIVDDARQWRNGYLPVKIGETWGFLDIDGRTIIDTVYQSIGCYDRDEKVTPVKENNQTYYIEENGYKKLVGDHKYEYLGNFGSGLAPACREGKYGWINREFKEFEMKYDYTTPFYNGIAAVKRNDKWALINDDLEFITKFKYDDIAFDENGYCANTDRIFVKEKNKYHLIDSDGKKVGKLKFDDVKAFNSDQYAAVKKGDAWGYINTDGKLVIDYKYDDAKSFYNGVAGYKENESWGIIAQDKEIIIPPTFADIKTMNSNGVVIVKSEEKWQCIQLYAFINYE